MDMKREECDAKLPAFIAEIVVLTGGAFDSVWAGMLKGKPLLGCILVVLVSAGCGASRQRDDSRNLVARVTSGMLETNAVRILAPVTVRRSLITWGGSGNHRLYVELVDNEQVLINVEGPYLSPQATVAHVESIEPLADWSTIVGLEPCREPVSR